MRAGLGLSVVAVALASICNGVLISTTTQQRPEATQLGIAGLLLFTGAVVTGAPRIASLSSVLLLGAAIIEPLANDEPSWVRSIAIGVLWYLTLEVAWEAIDRRDGASYAAAVSLRRIQEVGTVTALALVAGAGALALQSFAPLRTLPLQAAIIGALFIAFAAAIRRIAT